MPAGWGWWILLGFAWYISHFESHSYFVRVGITDKG